VLALAAGSLADTLTTRTSIDVGEEPAMLAALYLPTADSFAANVIVYGVIATQTVAEAIADAKAEFFKRGHNVLRAEVTADGMGHLETIGRESERTCHFRQKIFIKGNVMFLVTETALADRWDIQQDKLAEMVAGVEVKADTK
jgi:hypothetical protein